MPKEKCVERGTPPHLFLFEKAAQWYICIISSGSVSFSMGCRGTASMEDWCFLETKKQGGMFPSDSSCASAGQQLLLLREQGDFSPCSIPQILQSRVANGP